MNKEHRIRKNEQFQTIIKKGTLYKYSLCYCYYMPNELDKLRIGIAVSKKVGNAVIRNKIKRQIRAIVRPYVRTHTGDYIFVAKKDILKHSFNELSQTIAIIFDENGEYNEKKES